MLGISIYPEKEKIKDTLNYIDLAAKYHFKRIFTCLLSANGSKKEIIAHFQTIITHARKKGFLVVLDVNPNVFAKLNISYDDLSFFHEIKATGIRLDTGFDGAKEAIMTYNPYDLDIEINLSHKGKYIDQILNNAPKKNKIIACHNFYPMRYSGLSYEFFAKTTQHFKNLNIKTAAFVASHSGDHGPWSVMDNGLPTLEMHRDLPIESQVKHLLMTKLVDDIIIGNAFASEDELKAISQIFIPTFKIKVAKNISQIEQKILFDETHKYRSDISDYFIRSSQPRVKYKNTSIPKYNTKTMHEVGEIYICNDSFKEYKGEVHIVKKNYLDESQRENLVAKIALQETFLLNYLEPNSIFQFTKDDAF